MSLAPPLAMTQGRSGFALDSCEVTQMALAAQASSTMPESRLPEARVDESVEYEVDAFTFKAAPVLLMLATHKDSSHPSSPLQW